MYDVPKFDATCPPWWDGTIAVVVATPLYRLSGPCCVPPDGRNAKSNRHVPNHDVSDREHTNERDPGMSTIVVCDFWGGGGKEETNKSRVSTEHGKFQEYCLSINST